MDKNKRVHFVFYTRLVCILIPLGACSSPPNPSPKTSRTNDAATSNPQHQTNTTTSELKEPKQTDDPIGLSIRNRAVKLGPDETSLAFTNAEETEPEANSTTVYLLEGDAGANGSSGADVFGGVTPRTIVTLQSSTSGGSISMTQAGSTPARSYSAESGALAWMILTRDQHDEIDGGEISAEPLGTSNGLAQRLGPSSSDLIKFQQSFLLLAADISSASTNFMSKDLCGELQKYGANQSCLDVNIPYQDYTSFVFVGYYGLEPGAALMRITTTEVDPTQRVVLMNDTFLRQASQRLPPMDCTTSEEDSVLSALDSDANHSCQPTNLDATIAYLGATEHIPIATTELNETTPSTILSSGCVDGQVPVAYGCDDFTVHNNDTCGWSCEYIGLSTLHTAGTLALGTPSSGIACPEGQNSTAQWNGSQWVCADNLQLGDPNTIPTTGARLSIEAPAARIDTPVKTTTAASDSNTLSLSSQDEILGALVTTTSNATAATALILGKNTSGGYIIDQHLTVASAASYTITPPALRIHDNAEEVVLTISPRGDVVGNEAYMGAMTNQTDAFFAHRQSLSTSGYALKQTTSGATTLNTPNDSLILAVAGTTVGTLSTSAIQLLKPLTISYNTDDDSNATGLVIGDENTNITLTPDKIERTDSGTGLLEVTNSLHIQGNLNLGSTEDTDTDTTPSLTISSTDEASVITTDKLTTTADSLTIEGDLIVTGHVAKGDMPLIKVQWIGDLTKGGGENDFTRELDQSCDDYSAATITGFNVNELDLNEDSNSYWRMALYCDPSSHKWNIIVNIPNDGDDSSEDDYDITAIFYHWSLVTAKDGYSNTDDSCPYDSGTNAGENFRGFINTAGEAIFCR